jgi:hypothetical protein
MQPITPPEMNLIQDIPSPEAVRERLSHAIREVQLLRQLLRLAERASKDRQRQATRKGREA